MGRCGVEEIEDEEVSDAFSEDGADQRDGFSKIRADQCDGTSKFTQIKDDDEEVNAIETVQEVVEVTVDSGAAKSVWPSRKKGVERTKSTKT